MKRKVKIPGFKEDFYIYQTIGDGSCLLHAIFFCFNKTYKELENLEKRRMIQGIRTLLSAVLEETEGKKTFYENLGGGEILELSKNLPEARLNYMKKYLLSSQWLNIFYLELISNQFDLDIYIFRESTGKFYPLGDLEGYYKGRKSIIINYQDDVHFEAMGVKMDKIRTLFDPECKFVKKIKDCINPDKKNK